MGRIVCFSLLLAVLVSGICREGRAQAVRETPIPVVINEVLAANGRINRDPQGQYEDWIELYNWGRFAVDVGGCYLTDDLARPTKWQIPIGSPAATTIPAQGFLLIWADGDIADPGLHAGFRLSDEGEEVGLFAPDGVKRIDSLTFGKQYTDVSYGRYPDGEPDLRLLSVPTPAAKNVLIHEGIVEAPQFDVKSRVCTAPITVTLTTATEGAEIYYTVDGSTPFAAARGRPIGSTYKGPLVISRTVTVKAVAWLPGWRQSEVKTERYVFIGPELQSFSSPLAIAVIDTFGKGVSRTPVPAYGCFIAVGEGGRAFMTDAADFAGAAAINIRGKSSEGFPKHQYHFETRDEQGDDQDVSILGLPAESDWVLQGPYSDKSLMRNVLSYRWANEMGRYAPRTRYIEMFLNSDDTTVSMADYAGVYVLMEKIKIGPNRVDVTELEAGDNAEPEITGGYIIKKDKFDSDDMSFTTSRGQTLIYQDPNGRDLTPAQRNWIRSYVNSFEAALYGPGFRDPVNGYAQFIDVGSFIDLHILVELTKNIDGFRLSTYMHKDRAGRLHMGPAWDYNLSLGNANYLNGWVPTGWYFSQLGDDAYPYWRRLFEDPEFRLAYADRWFALRRDLLATNRLIDMIEGYAALLDEPAARNFDRWRILGQYVWPNWYIARTFREEIAWMQKWLVDRLAWMDGQIAVELAPAPPAFSRQGGHVEAGFLLTMSGPGAIYYTMDGSDPGRPAGSQMSAQSNRYTERVPLTESVQIRARSLNAGRWSALNEAVFAVGPVAESVRISEIMYHPAAEISEAEYIELTNIGPAAVNLNLVRFTDGLAFTFPSIHLSPAAYCLVVKDVGVFEARYGPGLPVAGQYTGSLDNAGERIELRDAAGRMIHSVRYRDDWYDRTDGEGFSLTLIDPAGVDPNSLDDKASWRPSTHAGGSPGSAD